MNLEEQKNILRSLREELAGRVDRTYKHIHERDERVSGNFSDQSQEMENQELVFNLDAEGREELRLIDEALQRIADDAYGICQECGKQVQEGRIKAVPYTRYCIECATSQEE